MNLKLLILLCFVMGGSNVLAQKWRHPFARYFGVAFSSDLTYGYGVPSDHFDPFLDPLSVSSWRKNTRPSSGRYFSLAVNKEDGNRFSFSYGLAFGSRGYSTKPSQELIYHQSAFDLTEPNSEAYRIYRYRFTSIPLKARYVFSKGKNQWYVGLGFNLYYDNRLRTLDHLLIDGQEVEKVRSDLVLSGGEIGTSLEIGWQKFFHENWILRVAPVIRYYPNQRKFENRLIVKDVTLGLAAGIYLPWARKKEKKREKSK